MLLPLFTGMILYCMHISITCKLVSTLLRESKNWSPTVYLCEAYRLYVFNARVLINVYQIVEMKVVIGWG